jgi:DNA-binding PadR family transcriptional regulator
MMNLNKLLPLTETTYYILLALCEPLHGYGIILRVKALSSESEDIAPGTLYGALENLSKQQLIALVAEDAEKRRKIYALTDLGRQVLEMEYSRIKRLVEISKPLLGGSF